jgi:hypothetical protein
MVAFAGWVIVPFRTYFKIRIGYDTRPDLVPVKGEPYTNIGPYIDVLPYNRFKEIVSRGYKEGAEIAIAGASDCLT